VNPAFAGGVNVACEKKPPIAKEIVEYIFGDAVSNIAPKA
jgi:hypothetical protein